MIDFTRLCKERNIPFLEHGHHHCHEGWIQVNCPFCGEGKSGWHLGFSKEGGNMHCWKCGSHSVNDWLRRLFPDNIVKQIWHEYDIKDLRIVKTKINKYRERNVSPPPGMESLSNAHKNYLIHRGYDADKLEEKWGLKGTRFFSGEWNWRVIAPIHNQEGKKIVAYTGRSISETVKPKWKTTSKDKIGIDPKRLIYGIEKTDTDTGVLIVEGPGDVWRMGVGCVALLGIDWKVEQANILRHYARRFIMFDPEPQAQKRAKGLAAWLSVFPGETEVITGIETDPGAMTQDEADAIMKELKLRH